MEKTQDCQTQLLCDCIAIASRCNLRHPTAVQPMAGYKGTEEGRCRHRSSHTHAIRHACKRKASPTTEMRVTIHSHLRPSSLSIARRTKLLNNCTVTDMGSFLANGCISIYILIQCIRSMPIQVIHRISVPLPPHWYVGNAPDFLHSPT